MNDSRSQQPDSLPIRRVNIKPSTEVAYCPPSGNPEIIHEDEHFVIVDKPSGLLTVPGIAPEKKDCLRSRIQDMYPLATGPMTCHRLDQSTSGVMILTLDANTHRNLSRQFEQRKVQKRYIALLDGHLQSDEGTIHCPMRKDMDVRPLMLVDYIQGKPSTTHYKVLAREELDSKPITRVEFVPHTGRTHQLRVHAAHPLIATVGEMGMNDPEETKGLGMPIVGDELYSSDNTNRLMLHASMLTIFHPVSGKQMTFNSPIPF
ncbi:MAG: RluA family pseudouridine synthase [Phycisphaerales bacterium]|nr:RluA family pseudouridine synthase [Phycisphaerales bacterium]